MKICPLIRQSAKKINLSGDFTKLLKCSPNVRKENTVSILYYFMELEGLAVRAKTFGSSPGQLFVDI
jgi:hypothetical protein